MRIGILSFLGCLVIAVPAVAGELRIEYDYAGLTSIHVNEQRQILLTWHTRRLPFDNNDISPMRQSLDAFDSHSSTIWLTESELNELEKWIINNAILEFPLTYPEPEEKTYGSAYRYSLAVEYDGKKHSLEWTGDTKISDSLNEAVKELMKICHEIRKSREEQ